MSGKVSFNFLVVLICKIEQDSIVVYSHFSSQPFTFDNLLEIDVLHFLQFLLLLLPLFVGLIRFLDSFFGLLLLWFSFLFSFFGDWRALWAWIRAGVRVRVIASRGAGKSTKVWFGISVVRIISNIGSLVDILAFKTSCSIAVALLLSYFFFGGVLSALSSLILFALVAFFVVVPLGSILAGCSLSASFCIRNKIVRWSLIRHLRHVASHRWVVQFVAVFVHCVVADNALAVGHLRILTLTGR